MTSRRNWSWLCLLLTLSGSAALPLGVSAQEKPLRQIIDAEVKAAGERENVPPGRPADDATFLRRVSLDLIGTIPTYAEARQFLEDGAPDKRTKWIDRLLDDPRFAAHQATTWDLVLFGRNPPNPDATRKRDPFVQWLTGQFARNEPYDRWVRALLTADGHTQEHGPTLFYAQFRGTPEETATAVSRIFLGTQLQCARCHDHPSERWTQLDFYGLAAFFARLAVVEAGGGANNRRYLVAEKSTGEVLFTGPAIQQKPGQKGEPVKARFLGGAELAEPPPPAGFKEPDLKGAKTAPKPFFSRREKLAEWVTAADNPYFARAIANRLWGQFLRRGLVHPVDNLSSQAQRASHPALLDALTGAMLAHRFDLKWFIRELVNSATYQLASTGGDGEPHAYERARLRALSAEEMLAALRVATGFDDTGKPPELKLPAGLPEQIVRHFGSATDGQGEFQASLTERLFVANSAALRQLLQRRKGNLADVLLGSAEPWEARVDRLFLTVLTRPPRPEERERFVKYLAGAAKPDLLVEEVIWALVSSGEFRFNH